MTAEAADTEPYCVDDLVARVQDGWTPKYVCFWGHESSSREVGRECLSQWYPAAFEVGGVPFATAEHFMMHRKALLFGDDEIAAKIAAAKHPGEAKKLGRAVRGFVESRWEAARFDVVVAGNVAKFEQNEDLGSFLRGTWPRVLVEASPRDRIWGIGLGAKDAGSRVPSSWRGLNLLGFALMKARAKLMQP